MTKEQAKQAAKDHPFQVIKIIDDKGHLYLLLDGDRMIESPNESFKDKTTIASFCSQGESDVIFRLNDLRDDYKYLTATDGSKVNWKPLEINENIQ